VSTQDCIFLKSMVDLQFLCLLTKGGSEQRRQEDSVPWWLG
jgi:hypothetical protein